MLRDPDRLRRLLLDPDRPIQLVVAGKAHPADDGGKSLIQQIVRFTDDPALRGRIVFLPDYDIGVFLPPSWLAVLVGQNIVPNGWDPRVDRLEPHVLSDKLAALRDDVRSTVDRTPDHMTFISDAAARAGSLR